MLGTLGHPPLLTGYTFDSEWLENFNQCYFTLCKKKRKRTELKGGGGKKLLMWKNEHVAQNWFQHF